MKNKFLAVAVGILLSLQPVQLLAIEEGISPKFILEQANERRQNIRKPSFDPALLADWTGAKLSRLYFQIPNAPFAATTPYSMQEIREDMDYLFSWFETMYGPYYYYGGNEKFHNIKEDIVNSLSQVNRIDGNAVETSLLTHFSFIDDAHLRFNGKGVTQPVVGFLSQDGFQRANGRYIHLPTGKQVQSINNMTNLDAHMVFGLSEDGNANYHFLLLASGEPGPAQIVFAGHDETASALTLVNTHQAAGSSGNSQRPVTVSYQNNIPIITISAMGFDQGEYVWGADLFLHYAEMFKNEPVLIVDLRDNTGGNSILPQKWFEAYTGEIVPTNYYQLRREDFYRATGQNAEDTQSAATYVPFSEYNYYTNPNAVNPSWTVQDNLTDKIIANDKLLVVLTNKRTASAADVFTDLAFNVENTVVIGSNTNGALFSNAFVGMMLPNTGITVQMGNSVNVFPQGHFEENMGFKPDLWVLGDAKTAALAFINNYIAATR